MKFPASKHLGHVLSPTGATYSLHFYGEDEGAAVVAGPVPFGGGKLVAIPEVHREPATNADDARAKLTAWRRVSGWPA